MGDPREVTPPFIREALLASVDAVSSYPRATGLPELREAVAALDRHALRRRRRPSDRDRADARLEGGDLLVRADRARREAARRGARARLSRLRARRAVRRRRGRDRAAARSRTAGCPISTRSTAWDEIALFWVCYPNNPTGAVAPLSFYEELAGACARARVPALLRRGVLGALVRRAAGRPRCRSPTGRTSSSSTRSRSARR